MKPITIIETPFPEKFGVPRQPLIIDEVKGLMTFPKDDFFSEAFRGIEGFSHLWLIFEFHQVDSENINPLVRPPRFDGKKKLGVFATRSPHRLNRLGLSVVKFESLKILENRIELWVSGVDLVSGTPILDIKPYVPYVDSVADAFAHEFTNPPKALQVQWQCERPNEEWTLIEKTLALDPRPSHQRDLDDEYGMSIANVNVRFKVKDGKVLILAITQLNK